MREPSMAAFFTPILGQLRRAACPDSSYLGTGPLLVVREERLPGTDALWASVDDRVRASAAPWIPGGADRGPFWRDDAIPPPGSVDDEAHSHH